MTSGQNASAYNKPIEQRLSVITLGVKHLQASRQFYESLGWQRVKVDGEENIIAFNLNGFVLSLYPLHDLADDVGMPLADAPSPSFTLAHNVASADDVDRLIAEVRAVGARVVKEPQKVFWGGYSAYFADLDGYLWEVAFNPFSKLEKDGSFNWV